jgi:hypothetical protein
MYIPSLTLSPFIYDFSGITAITTVSGPEYTNLNFSFLSLCLDADVTLNSLVSEAFVRFFVELVGHYSLNMTVTERGQRVFQREPFRKSHTSRSVRHFLDLFMETQMFAGFIQDRELRKSGVKGQFASDFSLFGLSLSFFFFCLF